MGVEAGASAEVGACSHEDEEEEEEDREPSSDGADFDLFSGTRVVIH